MELFRCPRSDDATYDRGWQLSGYCGLSQVALGYSFEGYRREWTLCVMLGPVTLRLWRVKP